jgi:hypothetical protein
VKALEVQQALAPTRLKSQEIQQVPLTTVMVQLPAPVQVLVLQTQLALPQLLLPQAVLALHIGRATSSRRQVGI